MADICPFVPASRRAAPVLPSLDNTTNPEAIRLHIQAENALCTALALLRREGLTAEQLDRATARAIRAASLLRQACTVARAEGVAA